MVQVGTRRFTPPKDAPRSDNVGRVRDPSGADEMNGDMEPVSSEFPYLREIKNPQMIYPWSAGMAARPDLVEGYDPRNARESNEAMGRAFKKSPRAPMTDDEVDRMMRLQEAALRDL